MEAVYLSLGSNLGDRAANLYGATAALSHIAEGLLLSSLYETEPLYDTEQPRFLNLCLRLEAAPEPAQLLSAAREIEASLGRRRDPNRPKGPRPVDIDIVLYGCRIIQTPGLTVPHQGMIERAFVLKPLLEIAPEIADPRDGTPLQKALSAIGDEGVYLYNGEPLY